MKKFARVLALMLVATMLCAMLVACGAKPASDPKEAKDALEENGYKATHLSGILVEAASSAFGDGVTDIVTGIDGDDSVTIVWFEEEDDAKDFYEELEEQYEESKAELDEIEDEDVKEELQEKLDNAAYGISGNMVWMGTKEAVKAAK